MCREVISENMNAKSCREIDGFEIDIKTVQILFAASSVVMWLGHQQLQWRPKSSPYLNKMIAILQTTFWNAVS